MYESRADRRPTPHIPWASLAPLACALHCLATPLFVLVAPTLAENPWTEWGLMAIAAALGAGSVLGSLKGRGERRAWVPISAGLLIWVIGASGWVERVPEQPLTIAGALLLSGGMLWNAWYRHQQACAACGGTDHE